MQGDRPLCKCHGEPMYRIASGWRCAAKARESSRRYRQANREKEREYKRRYREANPEKMRERYRRYYENLTGYQYNLLLLRQRRRAALRRMKQREERNRANG